MLASQTVFPDVAERSVLSALLLMQTGGALLLQLLELGSAYLLFFAAIPLFVALSLDALLNHGLVVSLWTYALVSLVPLLTGMQMSCVVLDVFVPLVRALVVSPEFCLFLNDIYCRPGGSGQKHRPSTLLRRSSQSCYR